MRAYIAGREACGGVCIDPGVNRRLKVLLASISGSQIS
jgi:hypothetical protein